MTEMTTDLELARERLRIYEGLARVLEEPTVFLDLVMGAEDSASAIRSLQARFGLDDLQACAAMDLQFRRATEQARSRVLNELAETRLWIQSIEGDAS